MSDLLEIRTLGALTIRRDDKPVVGFVSRKVEALVVYLAYHRQEHPREVLAELLWDERSQAQSMSNLRVTLTDLRQHLAPFVIITRQTVMLNPASTNWLDIAELDGAIKNAQEQWIGNAGLSDDGAVQLEQALALYRGDFLAGFHIRESTGFEDWMTLVRERARQQVIEAFHHLVSYSIRREAFADGIAQATRLLQLEPTREETYQQLILLLAKTGQRSAALAQYDACCHVLAHELGIEPNEETKSLLRQIQAGYIALPRFVADTPRHLPPQATPFVGRDLELRQLAAHLSNPECRLLTLVGPGGIGKTRLALQAAENVIGFADGVYFVPLASVSSSNSFVSTLADTLKFTFDSQKDTETQLIHHMLDKALLLVLDNFEHLLEGVELLSRILACVPQIKFLVTSQERLNLQEEWLITVDGMPFPDDNAGEPAETYSAVQLFTECARRVQPNFELGENTAAVIGICQLVEGMPLGLELAASWVRMMPCHEICKQIERSLDFLVTSLRNVPQRHTSLRALFEHTWNMLLESQRDVFMRLSIFRGDFDLQGADAVAGASLPVLNALLEKSLVRVAQPARYDLHEVLRQYAYDKLKAAGVASDLHIQHLDYYLSLAEEAALGLRRLEQGMRLDQLEQEHDNLRAALVWSLSNKEVQPALRLCGALWRFWSTRGYISEGRRWLNQVLALNPNENSSALATALLGAGVLAWSQGDHSPAATYYQASLRIRQEAGDELGAAEALNSLGLVAWSMGSYAEACSFCEESLKIRQRIGHKLGIASTLNNLGQAIVKQGDYARAHSLYEQSLALERELEDQQGIAATLCNQGILERERGNYAPAQIALQESLAIYRQLGHKLGLARTLYQLGLLANQRDETTTAYDLFEESLVLLRRLEDKPGIVEVLNRLADLRQFGDEAKSNIS